MELGFLTSCLPGLSLDEVVHRASQGGFRAVEVSAWPRHSGRDYKARHLPVESFNKADAVRIKDLLEANRIRISALAYYENTLDPDPARRKTCISHLKQVIKVSSLLDVNLVGTFVGGRPDKEAPANMKEIGKEFRKILSFAEDLGVKVMIENCPMVGWKKPGVPGNYAYSPELWEALFHEVPSPNFGINFDPSHLVWLGIDYIKAVRDFGSRIFHAHAKDCEISPEGLFRFGVYGEQLTSSPRNPGWWRYRIPGKGSIDWKAFVSALRNIGYDDVLSIELEDPDWEGDQDKTFEGLQRSGDFLTRILRV
ncbi:MAG: sugar phosphate isomerase/epimerase [Bacteroidota bacterium]